MSNKKILKKAFTKANFKGGLYDLEFQEDAEIFDDTDYYWAIFSHEFAKAFWGEKDWRNQSAEDRAKMQPPIGVWQYHLQQMVLEEDPIKYLEKYL